MSKPNLNPNLANISKAVFGHDQGTWKELEDALGAANLRRYKLPVPHIEFAAFEVWVPVPVSQKHLSEWWAVNERFLACMRSCVTTRNR
jgi:hypothetical protein